MGVPGPGGGGGWSGGLPGGDSSTSFPLMAAAVSGTHPTGMHSCPMLFQWKL